MKKKVLKEIIEAKIFRLKSEFYFLLAKYRVISIKKLIPKLL